MALLSWRDQWRVRLLASLGVAVTAALLVRLALFDLREDSGLFHPHGYCYLWRTDLVAAHVVSDGLIGGSYVAISLTLVYLVWRARRHLPFSWMFVAFGGFIIACGLTHFMEIWTLWEPVFWLSADVKIITAAASVATAILLPPLVPKVLGIVESAKLSEERRVALEAARTELEGRVAERTEQLQAALQRAEESNRLKEAFLSTVSHELRTPLGAIVGWSRMLMAPDADQAFIRKGLTVIDRNARVQTQLVDDLLDVSRLTAGTLRLQPEPMDLVKVVAEAIETVRPAADARQVTIELTRRAGPVPLVADARRLQQVAWNLLSNAVKFTPPGGRIDVAVDREGARAILEVRDNGIGIEPAFLPRLFERFTQADPSATRAHQGLGLGLAIAAQLTELHGGTIAGHSEGPGTGATFRVVLPIRTDAVPSAKETDSPSEDRHGLAGVRVLVVDDEPDTRDTLAEMLARAGAAVATAPSARAALNQLRGAPCDVLLSDFAMPDEDGCALITAVRASPERSLSGLPAVAISAYASERDRERALSCGFQVHVAKPVSPEALVSAVRSVLGR